MDTSAVEQALHNLGLEFSSSRNAVNVKLGLFRCKTKISYNHQKESFVYSYNKGLLIMCVLMQLALIFLSIDKTSTVVITSQIVSVGILSLLIILTESKILQIKKKVASLL
ncbi:MULTISPECIES: hypothetical protein [Aliivibrio]|uniref:hypothetical protein n=1 Tax=Aliivibrio TaxID=511678 RepID=UPI00080DB7D0|nr:MULTISPECIES: hypothetical protein [Aliivibrio]MBD1571554.1 hypothetical protein [Aliivibrio sp. S10_S31]MCE4937514.1 hypothetical protein [Aliivibrio fischeri]OCH02715.1 hypothetical protein A6E09_18520 [Aliivibrio fischeri]